MKKILLVVLAICASLLLFLPCIKNAAALEYLSEVLNTGYYSLDHGKYDMATYCFDKVLQNYPENSDALIGKASALIKLQMYDKAIPYLDKVLKIYPHNFIAIYYKAVVLSALGKHHDALFYYDQLQKMAPKFSLTGKDLKIIHSRFAIPYHTIIRHS